MLLLFFSSKFARIYIFDNDQYNGGEKKYKVENENNNLVACRRNDTRAIRFGSDGVAPRY